LSTRKTLLSLPDLRERCCIGLHVCFPGVLSQEGRVHAEELGCMYEAGDMLLAISECTRSKVDYTVSLWAGKRDAETHRFAIELHRRRQAPLMLPLQGADGERLTRARPLKRVDFSSLVMTCITSSGLHAIHAHAGFEFPWSSYTTIVPLPMKSPDERFMVRGIRIADAEDRHYVVLDVPGPKNETIRASCSLYMQDDVIADEELLERALDRLSEHVSGMVSVEEG